ncbi:MAG: RyR domain-containing protein [Verrucomicrobiota bacterium]
MSPAAPNHALTDPRVAAKLSDEDWAALHVRRFQKVRPRYVAYEDVLKQILKQACGNLAPLAMVEARPKALTSFAEKILRKRKLYVDPKDPLPPDPLVRITDLCGGRIITQTSDQVNAVCRFIERAFDIDWPNSEDVSQRLRPTEFGYRSVHYIVLVNPKKLQAAGITATIPKNVLGLKAEIQVRTLLEHAWADIGHDMTYKTEMKVPDRIKREAAALAAVLEDVDREFGRLVRGLDVFKSNFGAYHTRDEVEREINRLRIVLSRDSENVALAVKIAQLALSLGQHETALKILKPYATRPHQGVQRVTGVALTDMHWDHPRSKEFIQGRRSLEAACSHPEKDAETLCALAESWAREDESKARDLFHKAVAVDATEPVTLSRHIEFEVAHTTSNAVVRIVAPMIRNSMDRCRKEIGARVNLPYAWASLAVFHLLVGEPFDALKAIAQVIRLCDPPEGAAASVAGGCGQRGRPCAAGRALLRMRETLNRIRCISEKLCGFDWCERAVLLGVAARERDPEALAALREAACWKKDKPHVSATDSIVVLAGGCVPEVQDAIDAFKPHLLDACKGLSFTLFCGGTGRGISGVAGDMAEQSGGAIRAFGYMPKTLPLRIHEDTNRARFADHFSSPGNDFTPSDPLQGWTDIIVAGVDPHRVKLLCYAGKDIASCECAMALALGARVGVVEDPSLPRERQFKDPDWQDHPNLARLPKDTMTLRAFLLVDELPCKRKKFEHAAQKTHEEYVKSAIPKDPSLQSWEDLAEDLKISNFHQVAYAENILKTAGLGIREMTDPKKKLLDVEKALGRKRIRRMAEMEHGRWNVERLLLGWRYADEKDVVKKLSPYLVPWDKLPAKIQKYDLDAMRALPKTFRAAGLEVYRL